MIRSAGNEAEMPYPAGLPACFRLLTSQDLETLRAPAGLLRAGRARVKRLWFDQRGQYPSSPLLTFERFDELYGSEFDAVAAAVVDGNLAELAESVRRAGLRLEGHGIPFEDVVISLSHFENSCRQVLVESLPNDRTLQMVVEALDRLSHCRIILLSEAYFRSFRLRTGHGNWAVGPPPAQVDVDAVGFQGLVGRSEAMRRLFEQLIAAGRSQGSVLIRGESGTGKELAARAVHRLSERGEAPFVAINCAALPREMIESELFGHRKGAFTGAHDDHPGLFRAAGAGTMFLDEVTEMSVETQGKLLRVLQERTVRPVGSVEEVAVSARVLASTNRDPEWAMSRGLLRQDLYYRLQVHEIRLPPLREKPEDISLLINHFVRLNNERYSRQIRGLRPQALEQAVRYSWPGNVRELMNALERAFSTAQGEWIEPSDLLPSTAESRYVPEHSKTPGGAQEDGDWRGRMSPIGFPSLRDAQRDLLTRALLTTGGNKARAARLLGISRKQLYAKIARFGLEGTSPISPDHEPDETSP